MELLRVRLYRHPHDPRVWVKDYLDADGVVSGTTNVATKPAGAQDGAVVEVTRPIRG
jgi:hypothetical protein